MKIGCIQPEFVEFVPSELIAGTLYISMSYATTVHLCACGCGNKVVLPLSPADWQMYFDGESISLSPSVGNWEFPCRSHYWIKDNNVRLAPPWTERQVADGRARDAADFDRYLAVRHRANSVVPAAEQAEQESPSLPRRLWRWLHR